MADFTEIVDEIEELQKRLKKISDALENMKSKAANKKRIDAEELGIVVSDISELDRLMQERARAGH
jgi:SMC interacting uncharacterized protein involved in chromosome segregation